MLVAIPFFAFPKVLTREKEKIRLMEKAKLEGDMKKNSKPAPEQKDAKTYGKDIKGE